MVEVDDFSKDFNDKGSFLGIECYLIFYLLIFLSQILIS